MIAPHVGPRPRTAARPRPDGGARMSAIALGLDRTVLELKMYSREKEAVFFSFLFPILLLALFSVIFGSQFDGGDANGMTAGGYFLPGMLSAGVLLTSFQTMAMSVAARARRRHPQAAAGHPDAAGRLLPRQGRAGRDLLDRCRWPCSCSWPGSSSASSCPRRPTAGRCSRSSSRSGSSGAPCSASPTPRWRPRAPSARSSSARCWCCSSSPGSTSPSTTCRSGCSRSRRCSR